MMRDEKMEPQPNAEKRISGLKKGMHTLEWGIPRVMDKQRKAAKVLRINQCRQEIADIIHKVGNN